MLFYASQTVLSLAFFKVQLKCLCYTVLVTKCMKRFTFGFLLSRLLCVHNTGPSVRCFTCE